MLSISILISQIWYRPIDRDEGFFIGGAHLMKSGFEIYKDFAFFHLPLIPYIYAGLFKLFQTSIIWGRLFNVIATLLISLLLYLSIRKENKPSSRIAVILFLSSFMILNWQVPVKVHCILNLLLFSSCFFIQSGLDSKKTVYFLLGGLFLGLALSSRALVLPLIVVVLIYIIMKTQKLKPVILYISGLITGVIPILYHLTVNTDSFIFNNITIHIYAQREYVSHFERFYLLKDFLFQPDTLFLVCLTCILIIKYIRKRNPTINLILIFLITLFLSNFIPNSSTPQYHSIIIPYMVILASLAIDDIKLLSKKKILIPLILTLYFITGVARPVGRIYLDKYNQQLVGIGEISEASEELARISTRDTYIFSYWAGYVNRGVILPEALLVVFSTRVSYLISDEEFVKYKLINTEGVIDTIVSGKCDIIVKGVDFPEKINPHNLGDYRLYKNIGDTEIFIHKNDKK
jgi:4-amino-4-deoxy-L-arabinose transferase-like glycosyltransferase